MRINWKKIYAAWQRAHQCSGESAYFEWLAMIVKLSGIYEYSAGTSDSELEDIKMLAMVAGDHLTKVMQ